MQEGRKIAGVGSSCVEKGSGQDMRPTWKAGVRVGRKGLANQARFELHNDGVGGLMDFKHF